MPLLQILVRECRTRLSGRVWRTRWHLDPFAVLTVDGSQILRRQLIAMACFPTFSQLSRLLVLAEFLESRIATQRIPHRIKPEECRRDGRCAVNEGSVGRLQQLGES